MRVFGFLRLCAGIIADNVLTFQDSEVTTPVSLQDLLNSTGGSGCVGGHSANYVFTPGSEVGGCDANGN